MRPPLMTMPDGREIRSIPDFETFVRPSLSRVIAAANHKGGIGKTPCATNIPARLAAEPAIREAGLRYLIVDCDPQANSSDDLGIGRGRLADEGDDGAALAESLMTGAPLKVLRDVRPGLDVAVGGEAVSRINATYFHNLSENGENYAKTRLAVALSAVAAEYDLIFIDTPPSGVEILRQCLVAASRVLVPVSWDYTSQKGFNGVFERMGEAQEQNPGLDLLGAVLYGFTRVSGKAAGQTGGQRGTARADVEGLLEEAGATVPVFDTVISYTPPIAETVRKRGELPHELLEYTKDGAGTLTLDVGNGQSRKITATDLNNCVTEWGDLTSEVYNHLNQVLGS